MSRLFFVWGPMLMANDNNEYFPYRYSADTAAPWYTTFRAEDQPLSQILLHSVGYYLKTKNIKKTAPHEEVSYFIEQQTLLDRMASEGVEHTPTSLNIAFVGDLMWIKDNWDNFLDLQVLDYLNSHDLVFGNLETNISSRLPVTVAPISGVDFPTFNSPPALITSFTRPDGTNTFSFLSVANNHILDFYDDGARNTMAFLDQQGIARSGMRLSAAEKPYAIIDKNGIRLGVLGVTWGVNNKNRLEHTALTLNVARGISFVDDRQPDLGLIEAALSAMTAAKVDLKVVVVHWGFEYEFYPDPKIMQLARTIVRLGADLIVGSHSHVAQPSEVCFVNGYDGVPRTNYNSCLITTDDGRPRKAFIAYSLGNFTTVMNTKECSTGLITSLHITKDTSTNIVDWHAPRFRYVQNKGEKEQRRLRLLE
jgi:poly-gamma-glutamate capsule biosynthesis protein CapA/YwtB (metallophosphatase superfamily)